MIRLEGLRVRAGRFSLGIDDLSIAPGEYVMVLGPTASGKTVLLETVAGLRRPQVGQVWFDDREVTGEPPEKRGVGLVYQDYALFPHLTVEQNISFGLRWRREGRGARDEGGRVRELAGSLGIGNLLDRYPEGLSGGEQQRVALARALAIEPEVLLLDEPLSALDGPTRQELQGELKRVHQETGATVLHVTHDLDEALALGGRMAVLIDGELRQMGDPGLVTRRPADVEVARLVGLVNIFAVTDVREGRIRLENGLEFFADGLTMVAAPGRGYAVIRAEEIEIEPVAGPAAEASARQAPDGPGGRGNVLQGVVKAVQVQSVHASVGVEVPSDSSGAPPVLVVHVLRPQVKRLGLAPGLPVRLYVSPQAVHVCRGVDKASGDAPIRRTRP